MQKLLITLLLLLFVSEVYPAFANSESVSKEIEKVEIKNGMKIIYYKNGKREFFFSAIEVLGVDSSVETHVSYVSFPPFRIPIDAILRILKQVAEVLTASGVGCSLLAWEIWNCIKGLRRGRPKDYDGLSWRNF